MVNMGAIMSASLLLYMVKPEMSVSEKFEFVQDFFVRMAGGEHVGFQNSVLYSCSIVVLPSYNRLAQVFLSERETADRNHALAYFMRENKCFPR